MKGKGEMEEKWEKRKIIGDRVRNGENYNKLLPLL